MDISASTNITAHPPPGDEHYLENLTEFQRSLVNALRDVNAAALFGRANEVTIALDRTSRREVIQIVSRATHQEVNHISAEYLLRIAEELNRS